jgi:outer membrane lipoprotein-sorting protein
MMPPVFRLTVRLVLLLGLAVASTRAATPYPPEDLVSPNHAVNVSKPAAPWQSLIAKLQQKGDIHAQFTENRYLPFKKIPVVLKGEIRLSRDRGMSLHYTSPEARTLVVDAKGVLMRDGSNRTREMPADANALAATTALLHVMRFDLAPLSEQFSLYAAGTTDTWHFAFDPRQEALSKTLSRILVTGEQEQVRRIVMRKSALQRVEIEIGETRENVTFPADELARYFR